MAFHLFPTPVECKQCGNVVDDPVTDRCPRCGALLMERRTPSRLAGVERKYNSLRILLPAVRFLGVITMVVGVLVFLIGDDSLGFTQRGLIMLVAILVGTGLLVASALIRILADLEENSRASFSVQRAILARLARQDETG